MKVFLYFFPLFFLLILFQSNLLFALECSRQIEVLLQKAYSQSLLKSDVDKEEDAFELLCNTLYSFKNPSLLEMALTRRSYRNFLLEKQIRLKHARKQTSDSSPLSSQDAALLSMKAEGILDNERLEFLGDSIVGLIAAQILYEDDQKASEGLLSTKKSDLVSNVTLAKFGKAIGLDKVTFASEKEMQRSDKNVRFFSDTFEAYIAAIYEDSGHDLNLVTKIFKKILSLFDSKEIYTENKHVDTRSKLRNEIFKLYGVYPTFYINELDDGYFNVAIYVNGVLVASRERQGKKVAENELIEIILKGNLHHHLKIK